MRLDAEYRALGERLRAAMDVHRQHGGREAEIADLFRQLQELHGRVERVRQEISGRITTGG